MYSSSSSRSNNSNLTWTFTLKIHTLTVKSFDGVKRIFLRINEWTCTKTILFFQDQQVHIGEVCNSSLHSSQEHVPFRKIRAAVFYLQYRPCAWKGYFRSSIHDDPDGLWFHAIWTTYQSDSLEFIHLDKLHCILLWTMHTYIQGHPLGKNFEPQIWTKIAKNQQKNREKMDLPFTISSWHFVAFASWMPQTLLVCAGFGASVLHGEDKIYTVLRSTFKRRHDKLWRHRRNKATVIEL